MHLCRWEHNLCMGPKPRFCHFKHQEGHKNCPRLVPRQRDGSKYSEIIIYVPKRRYSQTVHWYKWEGGSDDNWLKTKPQTICKVNNQNKWKKFLGWLQHLTIRKTPYHTILSPYPISSFTVHWFGCSVRNFRIMISINLTRTHRYCC